MPAIAEEYPEAMPLAFSTIDTPVGTLLLVSFQDRLVRVSYIDSDSDVNDELMFLSHYFRTEPVEYSRVLMRAISEFDEYFSGERMHFTVPHELSLVHGFQREVLKQVIDVPYGETASYKELAIASGRPNAFRAAGSACGANPLLLVIPCHRIVKSDGSIGSYGTAGVWRKQFLLELEQRVSD
ncbi:MAG: methylated-DNA--[protein]-cysteine S-methyltransferase [Microbacteriaceae bacterium]